MLPAFVIRARGPRIMNILISAHANETDQSCVPLINCDGSPQIIDNDTAKFQSIFKQSRLRLVLFHFLSPPPPLRRLLRLLLLLLPRGESNNRRATGSRGEIAFKKIGVLINRLTRVSGAPR